MKSKVMIPIALAVILGGGIYMLIKSQETAHKSIMLLSNDPQIIAEGRTIYNKNCASCHGVALEGQANWRERMANGMLPAPPHNAQGHTWHHRDEYLFDITKYGIEKMLDMKYPNNMPVYDGVLTDDAIIAALSYIKSRWPKDIQARHDAMNQR